MSGESVSSLVFEDFALSLVAGEGFAVLSVLARGAGEFSAFYVVRVRDRSRESWSGFAKTGDSPARLVACAPEENRGAVALVVAREALSVLRASGEERREADRSVGQEVVDGR